MKNDDFQKIAVLVLGCLWDPSRAYFERVLGSKIEVLGGLGLVWGGLGWGWVVCCGVFGWSWGGLGWVWEARPFPPCTTVDGQVEPRGVRGA